MATAAEIIAKRRAADEKKKEAPPALEPTPAEKEAALDQIFNAAAQATGVPQGTHKVEPPVEAAPKNVKGKIQIYSSVPGSVIILNNRQVSLPYIVESEAELKQLKTDFNIDGPGAMLQSRKL